MQFIIAAKPPSREYKPCPLCGGPTGLKIVFDDPVPEVAHTSVSYMHDTVNISTIIPHPWLQLICYSCGARGRKVPAPDKVTTNSDGGVAFRADEEWMRLFGGDIWEPNGGR